MWLAACGYQPVIILSQTQIKIAVNVRSDLRINLLHDLENIFWGGILVPEMFV